MLTIEQVERAVCCEDIFVKDEKKIKVMYKEFIKKYHPDVYRERDLTSLISKINSLYEDAIRKIGKGIWEEKDVLILNVKGGKKIQLKYLVEHSFELGRFYVSRNHVVYVIEGSRRVFINNALKVLKNLQYANADMRKEFERYLPKIKSCYELVDNSICLVLEKTPDVILLSDLVDYYKGRGECLDSKHSAWIISRLNNLACFLRYNNLVHNGLSMDSLFVSPKYHSVCLYGGWWYCVKNGADMIGVRKEIFDLMPVKEKENKVGTFKTDLESIRAIGSRLNKGMPKPMEDWLNRGSSDNAYEEFESWGDALTKSFGERKFVELKISDREIYNK